MILVRLCVFMIHNLMGYGMTLPRYGRERYKNSHNLDILATYTQGMSKSYRRRDNPVVGLK